MSYQRLGLLGITLALLFWAVAWCMRLFIFAQPLSVPAAGVELGMLLGGALLFWWWIARRLDAADAKLHAQARRLATLHQAGLSITTEHDLAVMLQTVVDQSRLLIGARYGALGVLDEDGAQIEAFIVSGMDPHTEARLRPHLPKGHGILGLPIRKRHSIRVDDIAAHPAAVGFPAHHPPMHSFLGVPVAAKGKIFGHLYLTDKMPESEPHTPIDASAHRYGAERAMVGSRHTSASPDRQPPLPFDQEDQTLLEMFATQAAIAIENAMLYRQSRELAVLRERERFGMDLHDGVIQSIYAVGLLLDDGIHRLDGDPATAGARMREATQRLNTVIEDIRRYIHDLRAQSGDSHAHVNPLHELEQLAQTLRVDAGLETRLDVDAQTLRRFTPRQNAELLQIVREACANIRRHAQATRIRISLARASDSVVLEIEDNGRGFDYPPTASEKGQGLGNMAVRAQALGGVFAVETAPHQGCTLRLTLPLADA